MPSDFNDPTTWVFWIFAVMLTGCFFTLYFFPDGFTKKDREQHQDEVDYQKWIRGRTGETWDQNK